MTRQSQSQPQSQPQSQRPFRISWAYMLLVIGIYLTTACAWLVLWRVMDHRSEEKDNTMRSQVGQLWGSEHRHEAPELVLEAIPVPRTPQQQVKAADQQQVKAADQGTDQKRAAPAGQTAQGKDPPIQAEPEPKIPVECLAERSLRPERTRARAHLDLDHRRKGLLWYSTYRVRFEGHYAFSNPTPCQRTALLRVPFPARGAVYDEFSLKEHGKEIPVQIQNSNQQQDHGATATLTLAPGERRSFTVRYNSRGLGQWSYLFGKNTSRAKDFKLVVSTNFATIDFPEGTLSPSGKRERDQGWELTWQFNNILADANIAVGMPQKINPGPLAAEISLFAPVSLAFFFFVLLLVSVLKRVRLHPVHYGMLAAAFFSFHLLLAYLVDHLPLWLAFTLSSVTSVGLVVSYLRLAVGARFALLWAGGAQLLYLVLFSMAFFLEGYTGLTITIFSILTLFVVMQLTGRIDWSSRLGRPAPQDAGELAEDPPTTSFSRVS